MADIAQRNVPHGAEKIRTYLGVDRLIRQFGPSGAVRLVLVLQVEVGGGGTTCGSLARLAGITSGGTTHGIDQGAELGWLERYAGPNGDDRRQVWVKLTPLGAALAEHILQSLSETPAPKRISVMPLP